MFVRFLIDLLPPDSVREDDDGPCVQSSFRMLPIVLLLDDSAVAVQLIEEQLLKVVAQFLVLEKQRNGKLNPPCPKETPVRGGVKVGGLLFMTKDRQAQSREALTSLRAWIWLLSTCCFSKSLSSLSKRFQCQLMVSAVISCFLGCFVPVGWWHRLEISPDV